ncbi:MAG: hypothetical protein JNK29_02945, partial [Anaerolineales bacterium]|nr:hypothetical protein [Anaerolineales bacterium]
MAHRPGLALVILLGLHVSLGVAFSLTTPLFEAPDEENHFLFVRYLQLYRELPVQTLDPQGPRAHHPPLYHLLGALLSAWVPQTGNAHAIDMRVNPHVAFRYGDPGLENKALYVHYTPDERWPYRGQALAVHVTRLLSVAFSALAVLFTYGLARELRPDEPAFALLAAGLIAFNGSVLFMAGVVQNATAALASGAAILYTLGRGLRRGFTFRRWLAVGLALAGGVLLQTSALTLAAAVGLAGLYDLGRRRAQLARVVREAGLGLGLPVALLDGWWFWRNQLLYGDWTANRTIAALWTYGPIQPLSQTVYNMATGLVGRYGQGLMVDYPPVVYYVAYAVSLLAVAGALRVIWRARPRQWTRPALAAWLTPGRAQWVMHGGAVAAVSLALLVYLYFYIHGLHGRYAFTVFPSLAVMFAGGLLAWAPPRLHRRMAAAALAAAGLLAVSGLGRLAATYGPPPAPTSAQLQTMTPLDANLGDTARLLGYRLSAAKLKPGAALEVTVAWEPLSQTDVPYTIFLHLIDPVRGLLAQVDRYPGFGNWATTVWDVGRPFVDVYHLILPADAPAADARLVLGLYNAETMQRLPVAG